MPQKVGRDIENVVVKNGAVSFTVPETGVTLTLPQALDPARVDAIIDGHIRAHEAGYREDTLPRAKGMAAVGARIQGAAKQAESDLQAGGQMIRRLVPALDKLPSIKYRRPSPITADEQGGATAMKAAEVIVPAVTSGAAQVAGRGGVAIGRGTLAAWAKLPPVVREYLLKGAIGSAGFGAGQVLWEKLTGKR